jgi:hypothetical protein
MGDRTVVDPDALRVAAAAASTRAHAVRNASAAARGPMDRLAAELAGARTAREVAELHHAAAAVVVELAGALERLGRLLSAAAAGYGHAEGSAVRTMTPGAP